MPRPAGGRSLTGPHTQQKHAPWRTAAQQLQPSPLAVAAAAAPPPPFGLANSPKYSALTPPLSTLTKLPKQPPSTRTSTSTSTGTVGVHPQRSWHRR
ncbi:hypothetical protein PWT90_06105 [Aphanocladium album]|nr:hypothetical protein PWT90_06105 [Aphanocladium album]